MYFNYKLWLNNLVAFNVSCYSKKSLCLNYNCVLQLLISAQKSAKQRRFLFDSHSPQWDCWLEALLIRHISCGSALTCEINVRGDSGLDTGVHKKYIPIYSHLPFSCTLRQRLFMLKSTCHKVYINAQIWYIVWIETTTATATVNNHSVFSS